MRGVDQLVIDENNIAFHPMMGNSYRLNETAKEILQMLKEQNTSEMILERLSEKYGVSKEELYIDMNDFLRKLKIYGLDQ